MRVWESTQIWLFFLPRIYSSHSQYLVPWPANAYHPSDFISDVTTSGKPSLTSPPKLWAPCYKGSTALGNNNSNNSSHFWVFTLCSRHCDKCFTSIGSCSPSTILWGWLVFSFYWWGNWGPEILIMFPRSDSNKWWKRDLEPSSQVQTLLFITMLHGHPGDLSPPWLLSLISPLQLSWNRLLMCP